MTKNEKKDELLRQARLWDGLIGDLGDVIQVLATMDSYDVPAELNAWAEEALRIVSTCRIEMQKAYREAMESENEHLKNINV